MSDHNNRPADLGDEPPTYQTPDWETRSRRPGRRSLLGRFLPSGDKHTSEKVSAAAPPPSVLPADLPITPDHHHSSHHRHVASLPAATGRPSMRERFDAILPPNRSYLGRSRRFLLRFVILPLAVLLLLVLPLALGLGLGLSSSSSHRSSQQDLPLPSNRATFSGDITYYNPGLGACGIVSSPDDAICAVSQIVFDAASTGSNPNTNPLCGKKIRITRDFVESGAGLRSVDVTVVDRCTGCAQTDLDLTTSVFDQLAPEESGRVVASWAWLS